MLDAYIIDWFRKQEEEQRKKEEERPRVYINILEIPPAREEGGKEGIESSIVIPLQNRLYFA